MYDRINQSLDEADFEIIRQGLYSRTGFNVGNYKQEQVKRLLSTIMARAGASSFGEYLQMLRHDPKKVDDFKKYITINVTEFFRDRELFDTMEQAILPELLRHNRKLMSWSAGCASGEEPYSLAILLEEKMNEMVMDYRVLATDIDQKSLEHAQAGLYQERALKNVAPRLLRKYFTRVKDEYQVKPKLKSRVKFQADDLLKSAHHEAFDLVLCRNVVIYFTERSKSQLYRNLYKALKPGGVLFIGATENLLDYRDFGFQKIETYFFKKPA